MELVKSNVLFDEQTHTYTTENGKKLQSVTEFLAENVFKDKYKGVPEDVLEKAAARGKEVHELCQWQDEVGVLATHDANYIVEAAHAYAQLREGGCFAPLANEYLVSDNEHLAGTIDCVWIKDNSIYLADIKTTYTLDVEYLSWQLSIYAYLFEIQNLKKVNDLYAIYLPLRGEKFDEKDAKLIKINRIPSDTIQVVLSSFGEIAHRDVGKWYQNVGF